MCRRSFPALILLPLLLALATAARAAPWDRLALPVFRHVVSGEELPNDSVPSALAVDGTGYLWLGSQNGLSRWDGYRFHLFPADPHGGHTGPPDNMIQQLYADPSGRIWIGTASAGLSVYDPRSERFTPVALGGIGADPEIQIIVGDGQGGAWIGTGSQLMHVDASLALRARLAAAALPGGQVAAVCPGRQGALWLGGAAGLWRADGAGGHPQRQALPLWDGAPPKVVGLREDRAGRLWIGTEHAGVFVLDPARASLRPLAPPEPGESAPATVRTILELPDGRIWLAADDQGMFEVDAALRAHRLRHDPSVMTSPPDASLAAVAIGRDGLVWAATLRGIVVHDPRQRGFATIFAADRPRDGLGAAQVYAVVGMPEGQLWAGYETGGVDILDPEQGRVATLPSDPALPRSALPASPVRALLRLPGGPVLIGTEAGLYRASPDGRSVQRLTIPGRPPALPVWALLQQGPRVWIGGPDGAWAVEEDVMGALHPARHEEARLANPRVDALAATPDGAVWAGGVGLSRITDDAVEPIRPRPGDPGALPSLHIASLSVDPAGRLWVGTEDAGLAVAVEWIPGRGPRFRTVGMAQGLPNGDINRMLWDRAGRLWVSTDVGLAVVDPVRLAAHAFGRPEGVGLRAFWESSGAALPDGALAFGGVGGLLIVRPEAVTAEPSTAPVVVTERRIDGDPVPALAPLILTPERRTLAVEFALLEPLAPESVRYAYRMDGFDNGWIRTDAAHRQAVYTNLPPGRYVLRVAAERGGEWREAHPLDVLVTPAWYQTTAFRLALVVAGLVGVLGLIQVRTAWLRARQHALEREVQARTAELHERTVELSASQERLRQYAYTDLLTGLANRHAFQEALRQVLAQPPDEGFAMLLFDLDGFKTVNDTLGHDAGDEVLAVVARRLRAALREGDFLARLGGDEFVALITGPAAVAPACARILDALGRPIALAAGPARIGVSIGVACFPEDGQEAEHLYKSSDIALYAAKRAGGGCLRQAALAAAE